MSEPKVNSRLYANLSLGLFIGGLFITLLLIATGALLAAFIFLCVTQLVALVFGVLGRSRRRAQVAMVGLIGSFVLFGVLFLKTRSTIHRYHSTAAIVRFQLSEGTNANWAVSDEMAKIRKVASHFVSDKDVRVVLLDSAGSTGRGGFLSISTSGSNGAEVVASCNQIAKQYVLLDEGGIKRMLIQKATLLSGS